MKKSSIVAAAGLAAGILLGAWPLCAQENPSAPIVVRSSGPKTSTESTKGNWLKAEVIHADSHSIIVREQANGMMIHTFTFTPELQVKMQKMMDQGGYQYGDKVRILYQHGDTVALKVRGKPSKAI